jgi:N utilization substance protein A
MPSNRKKVKNRKSKPKTAKTKKARTAAPAGKATRPSRTKRASKKKQSRKKAAKARPPRNQRSPGKGAPLFESAQRRPDTVSGRQSGDLQGVSRAEQADSESVDELVSEGNLFEAGAVAGVEEADNADEKEVHTHEVPEDDVPKEYLDDE